MTSLALVAAFALGAGACAAKPAATGSLGGVSTTPPNSAPAGTGGGTPTPSASPAPILPDGRST